MCISYRAFCHMFRNNQQVHQFLLVCYVTLLLLHVSATVYHPQGAVLYLLSYMPTLVLVNNIPFSMWLCVYYVAAWCISMSVYSAQYVRTGQNGQTDRYAPGRHIIYTQPHITRNIINQKPKLGCNSEGTDELLEDGIQLPKHVGAAK
jgi:hypothetical protein